MKKFKLIKEYPGSFELGAIGIQRGKFLFILRGGYEAKSKVDFYAEDYPEFWQEILEN